MTALPAAIAELRDPRTIRARCQALASLAEAGELAHFRIALDRLDEAADLVASVTKLRYPRLDIPPHSRFGHFDAAGVPRLARLLDELAPLDARERARRLMDVVVTSVLLDAGAGPTWTYAEAEGNVRIGRSEGLAVASLVWARAGGFSSRARAYEVDAAGLSAVTEGALTEAFQVSAQNPLVGVAGRVHLLRELGAVLVARPDVFGPDARLGHLVDHLAGQSQGGDLEASAILAAVLDALGAIWPGRLTLHGVPLGDVWRHSRADGTGDTAGLVPFHKLSQWLSYSLVYPLEAAGLLVRNLDALTGLAEYRNGGLFLDAGVLVPRHDAVLGEAHEVGSEVIVEFRALTVALLDAIAPRVRERLSVDAAQMPLAAVLEGGTWAAGRELARKLRADGGPPIRVISDGTVF